MAPGVIDQELGPYRIHSELGSGGMGTVYLAETETGQRVAVKVIHPHLLQTPRFFKRFLREAELGRRVRHPNVVRALDADSVATDGQQHHFIVMEYVEGQTLRSLLRDLERLPEQLCRHVGREIARGLGAIHDAGAVHRDLKPENVLLTPDHVVKIMDLGVARLTEETTRLSTTGQFIGSLLYAAPEQFEGIDSDYRADYYALGLILYELATGTHPSWGKDLGAVMRRRLDETPRPVCELNPQLSPFFEALVGDLLTRDREARLVSFPEGEATSWWRERSASHPPSASTRLIRVPRGTALHGRSSELDRMNELFGKARAGEGQVLLIGGEAGIGKTRLVDEFAAGIGRDAKFLFGSYPPAGAATALGAFARAFRTAFGSGGSARYLTETPTLVPAFDALLAGNAPPTGHEPLSPDAIRSVFVHATRALAAEHPTVLLIDDLHFAPEEGRALFAALAHAMEGHRILLIGTARPDLPDSWAGTLDRSENVTRLTLGRLSPKDLDRLLVEAFESEQLAEELGWRIAKKSDGNPYFAFEIVQSLKDEKLIARNESGAWETTRIIEELTVPSTIKDLIQTRIAGLRDDEKNILDAAACAGFEFDPLLLADALTTPPIPLLQSLARIERRHRLVHSAGRHFVFDHHQVQEALYEGLPEPLREAYHGALADALARREAPEEAEVVQLCIHMLRGGRAERTLPYLRRAFQHLHKTLRYEQTLRIADLALQELPPESRYEALEAKATCLHALGRRAEESEILDQALAAAPDVRAQAQIHFMRGAHSVRMARHEGAIAELERAVQLAQEIGSEEMEGKAAATLGIVHYYMARNEKALVYIDRALELLERSGATHRQGVVQDNRGAVLFHMGRWDESQACHERAIALAEEHGQRRLIAHAYGNLGNLFGKVGRVEEALRCFQLQVDVAHEIGHRHGLAVGSGNLGHALLDLGRITEAKRAYDRQFRVAEDLGDGHVASLAADNLGNVAVYLGQHDEARERKTDALRRAREAQDPRVEGFALHGLGFVAQRVGEAGQAAELYAEALELQREIGHRDGVAATLFRIGQMAIEAWQEERAIEVLDECLAIAREMPLPRALPVATATRALVPGGDVEAATRALEEHGAELGLTDEVEACLALYRASGDESHARRGHEALQRMLALAPEEYREAMAQDIPEHRDLLEAWTRIERA